MKLWLLRHPKPQVAPGLCYGSSDVVCDEQDLQNAAQSLQQQWLQLGKDTPVICSPLQRCEQTLLILPGQGPDLVYKIDARLAEMHFGDWELRPWAEISQRELTDWTDDFTNYRCGTHGESTSQLVHRVAQRLYESLLSGSEDEIWVTHAGVMRALLWLERQGLSGNELTALAAAPLQAGLRAADWPQDEIPFGQWLTVALWPLPP